MDLIDKITVILKKLEINNPIIDIRFDNQKNVIGHVSSESFKTKSDEESQELIWTALKKNLESSELVRVIAIFHETPQGRIERFQGYRTKEVKHSNFWSHQTPELAKYWLFIDVAKIGDLFKSFYIIINEKDNISEGLTFVYNQEVLKFMELEQNEIHDELYTNTYQNGEADIKMYLMNHYEKLTSQQLWGKANMYWYVYEDFQMTPMSKTNMIFNDKEIAMIRMRIKNLQDFAIINDIEEIIKKSELINQLKQKIS